MIEIIVTIVGVIGYLFIGVVIETILSDQCDFDMSILTIAVWPLALVALIFMFIMDFAVKIGEKIKNMMNK